MGLNERNDVNGKDTIPGSETGLDEEDEFSGESTRIPLGEWMNQYRSSRRIAGLDPVENCADVDPLLNYRTTENDVSLMCTAIGNDACDLSHFEPTYKENNMLRKVVNTQKHQTIVILLKTARQFSS